MLDKTEVAGSGGDPLHLHATSAAKQQVTALRGPPPDSAGKLHYLVCEEQQPWFHAQSQVKRVAFCSLTDLTKLVLGHPRRSTGVSQSDVRCTC